MRVTVRPRSWVQSLAKAGDFLCIALTFYILNRMTGTTWAIVQTWHQGSCVIMREKYCRLKHMRPGYFATKKNTPQNQKPPVGKGK